VQSIKAAKTVVDMFMDMETKELLNKGISGIKNVILKLRENGWKEVETISFAEEMLKEIIPLKNGTNYLKSMTLNVIIVAKK